jgi:flagellar biosynthetic protein FliP
MGKRRLAAALALAVAVGAAASGAAAQSMTFDFGQGGGSSTAQIVQIFALVTVLSLAPSILVMATSFVRIVVVLSFLRTALGVQGTPPNAVMISLALFLTGFVMAPVFQQAYAEGIVPLINEDIEPVQAFQRTVAPVHGFMMRHVREEDLILFSDLARTGPIATPQDTPLHVLIPAFMISELRRAFEIGFLLFLPFLIIDMVVASILMSMGMMMLPPAAVAMPFKIIFFVLVDGWHLIAGTLVQSFGT